MRWRAKIEVHEGVPVRRFVATKENEVGEIAETETKNPESRVCGDYRAAKRRKIHTAESPGGAESGDCHFEATNQPATVFREL